MSYIEEIIGVVLGLIFVWLILSMATLQIQEWISGVAHTRSVGLQKTIEHMLNSKTLAEIFYDHPLISTLSNSTSDKRKFRPSYIPPGTFASTLIDMIANSGRESWLLLLGLTELRRKLNSIRSTEIRTPASAELDRLVEIAKLSLQAESGKPFGNIMLTTLEKDIAEWGHKYPVLGDEIQKMMEKFHFQQEQIEKLTKGTTHARGNTPEIDALLKGIISLQVINPHLKQILTSLLTTMDEAHKNGESMISSMQLRLEIWFNDSMDRLTGWYRRKTQTSTILVGCILALVFNVDSIHLANQLWREPLLREIIIANADYYVSQGNPAENPDWLEFVSNSPIGLREFPLPVGWSLIEASDAASCQFIPISPQQSFGVLWNGGCIRPAETHDSTNGAFWVIAKLVGLLISGLAASQGSAFWFDILAKFINIRLAGKKPDSEARLPGS